MDEDNEGNQDKDYIEIIPLVRIMVSGMTPDNDCAEIQELIGLFDESSPVEFIKKCLDDGIVNVELFCFNERYKLI